MSPSRHAAPAIDEALVARLWDAQYPLSFPLRTVDGEEIRVVYRGRRRFDRGPDFPGALVAMPGERLLFGDLEVHVRTSDWRRHGHHRDPHYDQVILHVVLWHDAREPCLRHDGMAVPVLELAGHLMQPIESLLAANPSKTPRPAPCLPGSACSPDLAALLEACGMARFDGKVSRYLGDLACMDVEEALYRGIADVLGYSHNREQFRRLAELLPLETLLRYRESVGRREGTEGREGMYPPLPLGDSPSLPLPLGEGRGEGLPQSPTPNTQHPTQSSHSLEALLLGAAGLLPSQRRTVVDDPYVAEVEAVWEQDGGRWVGCSMAGGEWQYFRVRPANFPARRVAALAAIVSRWPDSGLAALVIETICSLEPKRVARALEGLLLMPRREGYWSECSDFGQLLARPADPIGRGRAAEAAINALLPLLAAWAESVGDAAFAECVRGIYRLYPKRGDNELTRYVACQITGMSRPVASRSACRQQGLLHIFGSWCEVKHCSECPVSRLAGN